jgi:membrane protease YdiL (CAAX protease family)
MRLLNMQISLASLLKSHLLLVWQVLIGTILLATVQQLKAGNQISTLLVFVAFTGLNLLYVKLYSLQPELNYYWSLKKIPYFMYGSLSGGLLVTLPVLLAIASGKADATDIQWSRLSILSAGFTLLIIAWEELWFRSLLLNYINRYLPDVYISVLTGILFMAIHMLNPEINLIKDGPVLFLAGTLLTALYFYYRNIWLPAGVHFGNNFFGPLLSERLEEHRLFGEQGLIYISILFAGTTVFLLKLARRNRRLQNSLLVAQQEN